MTLTSEREPSRGQGIEKTTADAPRGKCFLRSNKVDHVVGGTGVSFPDKRGIIAPPSMSFTYISRE